MKKILLLSALIIFTGAAFSQDWNELSSLKKRLYVTHADTSRIYILLQIAEFEIFKPGELKADLDSAENLINAAQKLNQSFKSVDASGYITIVQSYLAKDRGDRVNGRLLMERAVNILAATNNKFLLGKAYMGMTDYFNYLVPVEQEQKIRYYEIAAGTYKAGGFIEQEAFCYKNLGEIIANPDSAFKKINEALKLYQSIHYKKLHGVYDLIGQYYVQKNDLKEAVKYFYIAWQTAVEQHETGGTLYEIENHLGIVYSRIDDYENESRYFTMAIKDARLANDINSVVMITVNLASTCLKLNKTIEATNILATISEADLTKTSSTTKCMFYRNMLLAYDRAGNFKVAEVYNRKLKEILKDTTLEPMTDVAAYRILITYYIDSRQYVDAEKYLNMADKSLSKTSALLEKLHVQQLWFRLDTSLHNYKSSVTHVVQLLAYSDSFNKTKSVRDLQQLQIQYETKAKESQISFLKQKSLFETKNTQQANIVRNYTLAGIVLLLIIAGLLYRQNLFKQRSNKIISANNNLLQKLLTEKEWLLKEVHHRVKNNLHTVICLLESQAAYLENDALKAIESSQHRIYAMSLIHQKLYQAEDIKTVDMDVYLNEFASYLDDSFGNPGNIQLKTSVEPIKLSIVQAIPIGLIVNEAITNSFKYAFPGNRPGVIAVRLREAGDLTELSIIDNGVGLPIEKEDKNIDSLGMTLIEGLTGDLNGKLDIANDHGTIIKILFEPKHFN